MESDFFSLLAGRDTVSAGGGMRLRLLSAQEVLEAGREADRLAEGERERALCANACLLARALEKRGRRAFESGQAVLSALPPGQIFALIQKWADFDRIENPSPTDGEDRANALKKAWSTRLMSALSGVCSEVLGRFRPKSGQRK